MKVGIIGAMDVEVAHLKSRLANASETTVAGMTFCEGQLADVPVVVVKCGIGKVAAGMCVQILADRYQVTHVINTGIAGSLDNRIDIEDVVVSTQALYHDVDVTFLGYPAGEMPGVGSITFDADATMRAAALRAVAEVAPGIQAFEGIVASGDQFICDDAQKERIVSQFGALCCEMEGCAIAHASTLNGLPFVIVRAISDKADGSETMGYEAFEAEAAEHCARIVERMVSVELSQ